MCFRLEAPPAGQEGVSSAAMLLIHWPANSRRPAGRGGLGRRFAHLAAPTDRLLGFRDRRPPNAILSFAAAPGSARFSAVAAKGYLCGRGDDLRRPADRSDGRPAAVAPEGRRLLQEAALPAFPFEPRLAFA